jgi:replicative DNA helicase
MAEIEREYRELATRIETHSLDLGRWIPSFRNRIRPLIPGEMMVVVADTGVGKTMIAQNIALATRLPTLMFSMELPRTLAFERYAAMATKRSGAAVFSAYQANGSVPWEESKALDHVHVCSEAKLTPSDIERITGVAGLKMGVRPSIVIVDYMQLIRGQGERYNRISDAAEELKVLAKSMNCIVVALSQVARKKDDDGEIYIHDCKDSGAIENSCGVMLGAWRDETSPTDIMWLKVLKNTKGVSGGFKVRCNIRESLLLDEYADDRAI